MATPNYRLVFSGRLRKGFKHAQVQQALAQLLKISPEQAGHLIQGERFRIKKALEKSKAERLLQKVRDRGAECSIEPIGPPTRSAGRTTTAAAVNEARPATAVETAAEVEKPVEVETPATDGPLSLDLPEPSLDNEATRPLTTVQPQGVGEEIVLGEGERAAYQPDDDSENVGTFFERSTAVENREETVRGERRKRLIWLAAGLVVLVVAGVALLLPVLTEEPPAPVVATAPAKPVNPRLAQTNRRLEQLNRSIKVWMIQYGSGFNPAQVTLERLQQDLGIGAQEMLDGWGTALRYEPGDRQYRVVSAGPDKAFGSADDLVRETSVK